MHVGCADMLTYSHMYMSSTEFHADPDGLPDVNRLSSSLLLSLTDRLELSANDLRSSAELM